MIVGVRLGWFIPSGAGVDVVPGTGVPVGTDVCMGKSVGTCWCETDELDAGVQEVNMETKRRRDKRVDRMSNFTFASSFLGWSVDHKDPA
jgi:hypothetical protein